VTDAVLRHSSRDAILVSLSLVHGTLLLTIPSAPLVAIAMWWTANTVAHNFIHLPFFRPRVLNRAYSVYLSLLLGLPQTLWRDRHLAHHAGRTWRMRWSGQMAVELSAVALLWGFWSLRGEPFLLGTMVTGWVAGLVLCGLQGYYEHSRGTVSHHGFFYNFLFFNDGFHVEHHARPGLHWSLLPGQRVSQSATSRYPAVLRWLEITPLDILERIVRRVRVLQRYVVRTHRRAFERLALGRTPRRVIIVGGGIFPRTALVFRQLFPDAELTIIDQSQRNIEIAAAIVDDRVRFLHATFQPELCAGADLLVIPLAFDGDRERLYANPPAPFVAVHDWIWRRRGEGAIVSPFLLKRLNLVRR
jgi:hypothetical protein